MAVVKQLPNPWMTPFLTLAEAAECLGVGRSSVYRAAEAGRLPTVTIGGRRKVPTAELYALQRTPLPARPAHPSVSAG